MRYYAIERVGTWLVERNGKPFAHTGYNEGAQEAAELIRDALNAYAEPPEPGSGKAARLINEDAKRRLGLPTTRPPIQLTGRIGSFCVGCLRAVDGKCSEFASGLPMKADGSEGTCCYRELPGGTPGKE